MRHALLLMLGLALGMTACRSRKAEAEVPPPAIPANLVRTETGLMVADLVTGQGTLAEGRRASVLYRGWLFEQGKPGKSFDATTDPKQPFTFLVGAGTVIAGWDEGVASMRKGGRRLLIVPPALGYGARGAGDAIPPNATLLFEVQLLDVQ